MTYLFILVLSMTTLMTISFSKINFLPEIDSSLFLIKQFYQDNIFQGIRYITVIPLNFGDTNRDEFTMLMKSLNQYSNNSLMLLEELTEDKFKINYFLVIQSGNGTDQLFMALDSIGNTIFGYSNVLILCNKGCSDVDQFAISRKAAKVNITDLIFVYFSDPVGDTEVTKESNGELSIIIENILISKRNTLRNNKMKFITNKNLLRHTLQQVKTRLEDYLTQLKKLPIKVLLFLRPLSVQENTIRNKTDFFGVEINLLKILVQLLNVSYVLEVGNISQYGSVFYNGTYTRALTDIFDKRSDLNINRYLLDESGPNAIVIPYDEDSYCFVMRKSKNKKRTWSVVMAFQTPVWITLLLVDITVFVLYLIFKEPHWKSITFLQSAVSATHIPMDRTDMRITWLFWLLFVVLINNAFVSTFVTQLMPQKRIVQYDTLESLASKNLTLLSEIGHFKVNHSHLDSDKLIPFYGNAYEIDDHTALLTSYLTRRQLFKMFSTEFYTVNECVGRRYVGPLMAPIHQNYDQTVSIIYRIMEMGLKEYWLNDYIANNISLVKNTSLTRDVRSVIDSPITLEELKNIFKYGLCGLVAAIISFFCEILYFKLTNRKREKPPPEITLVFPYNN